MAGFDRDENIERMREEYIKIQERVSHHIDGIISIYQFMRDVKYTLEENPEFGSEHIAQLEAEFDEIKTRLGGLLSNAPVDLPSGNRDLLSEDQ